MSPTCLIRQYQPNNAATELKNERRSEVQAEKRQIRHATYAVVTSATLSGWTAFGSRSCMGFVSALTLRGVVLQLSGCSASVVLARCNRGFEPLQAACRRQQSCYRPAMAATAAVPAVDAALPMAGAALLNPAASVKRIER